MLLLFFGEDKMSTFLSYEDALSALAEHWERPHTHDLIFRPKQNLIFERTKGKVDLGHQFVLIQLLKLFFEKLGEPVPKREMIEKVWEQKYEPQRHDNSVHVTIQRLKKLIEPEPDLPRYLHRSRAGYRLNGSCVLNAG